MRIFLLYAGVLLLSAYVVFGLFLLVMQSKFLYRPIREVTVTPGDRGLHFEDVTFQSLDGTALHGWYVPALDAPFTVLLCHGNGGNVMHRLESLDQFHAMNLSCFVFDYRGYGQSAGKPTEQGTYGDARAAYNWLTQTKGIPADRIIILGRSLGGSIAANLATQVPEAGLVVESAFTSFAEIGAKFYPYMPVRLFARYKYNTRQSLTRVHCPVLVVHSRDDKLIPFAFGRRLFEAANEPKQFLDVVGGHNDAYLVSRARYEAAWAQWLGTISDRDIAAQKTG